MPKTEHVKYTFEVKEGVASENDIQAPVSLQCIPINNEFEFLGNQGFLSIELENGISIKQANEIKKYLMMHVKNISITTF